MIDVLIAVVVLATGMLALAALQASLTRNAAETRSRTNAVSIANGVLDAIRAIADRPASMGYAYDELDEATWKAEVDRTEGMRTGVAADTSLTEPPAEAYGDLFSVEVGIERFVSSRDAAVCGSAADTPCFVPEATVAGLSDAPEFKRVTATVTWTDATGAEQSVSLSDVLSALPSSNAKLLVAKEMQPNPETRRPRVLIKVPDEQGVIPIAVGTDPYGRDQSTAATNPKPLRDETTGSAGTRFDTINYSAVGSNAEIQRRIETQVVTCTCEFGALPADPTADFADGTFSFFQTQLRPTTWTGSRYSVPELADDVGVSVPPARADPDVSQSRYCDDCCRDHHDPGGLDAGDAKFSPYRPDHDHYQLSGGTLQAVTTGNYMEACRLIRVQGVWRVASDLRLEHMSFLETADTAREFVPTDDATDKYEEFVKSYLQARVMPVETGGTPSDTLDDALDVPEFIPMGKANDTRYLHVRGLYLDYLEPDTRTFLASRLTACTESPQILCLLPYLPFVSVNATEVARYSRTPTVNPEITVTPGVINQDTSAPDGGVVQPVTTNAGNASEVLAGSEMARENTGLTDGGSVVHPTEAPGGTSAPLADSQAVEFLDCATCDADGDGRVDALDNCPAIPNPDQLNTDGASDGGNACDDDDDNDSIPDTSDNCPLVANPSQADTDGDGIGDACDGDFDNDGVPDASDNCPYNPNATQSDSDGDGVGDVCDTDMDNDGVDDADDNCPTIANPDQADGNGDGVGDACALPPGQDRDGDLVLNENDNCPFVPNPDQSDVDGDGIGDACDGNSFVDSDGDGVEDLADNCPANANPGQEDADGDGMGDVCDTDSDNDSVPDGSDNCPLVFNPDQADGDGDGIGSACDADEVTPIDFEARISVEGLDLTTAGTKPEFAWTRGTFGNNCQASSTSANANPNPYSCAGALGPDLTLTAGKYNRIQTVPLADDQSKFLSAYCTIPQGQGNPKIAEKRVCYNWRLDSVSVNGQPVAASPAVANSGKVGETSSIGLTGLGQGDVVRFNFTKEPGNTADGLDLLRLGQGVGYTCDPNTGALTFLEAQCQ